MPDTTSPSPARPEPPTASESSSTATATTGTGPRAAGGGQPAPRPSAEALQSVRDLFDTAVAEHRTSGITWALIGGHAHEQAVLAHGAAGARHLEGGDPAADSAPMDRATISRIASMSKSFTAATILALRDEDRLRLDDPAAQYVPEAAGITPAEPDCPPVTIRQLLTMSAGFVTDNPWGDRQQAMPRDRFTEVLTGGLSHVHRPDTGFEYSNTGYALLGRIIDEVTGQSFDDHIAERFLQPLGMADSAYDRDLLDTERTATGHRLADREDATRFEPLPFDGPGVYGAMAGMFSTVDDVAAWVRFLAAADRPDAADLPAPWDASLLATASRREIQQLHRIQDTPPLPAGKDGVSPGFDRVRGYGFGLAVERFADLGEIISHSGGYPGFGSFMCWHRDSGVGVVALANSKYAPAVPLSMQALRILRGAVPGLLAPARIRPAERTVQAADAMLDWLRGEDEEIADRWFADNMDLDQPRAERLRRRDAALAKAGLDRTALDGLSAAGATVMSRAHLRWDLPANGEEATAMRIDLLLDPRREALVQALDTSNPTT